MRDPLEEAGIEVANRMISSPLPTTGLGATFFVSDGKDSIYCGLCGHFLHYADVNFAVTYS